MDNVIEVCFLPDFRATIAASIKQFGVARVEKAMISDGFNSSYVKCLIRSIMSKEGW